MKKIILTLTIIASLNLNAQDDKKAKTLLNEVYDKVTSYDNIYINFKYALENTTEFIHQVTKGDVTLQGNKYVFNYLGATTIYDGKYTYSIIPENEEIIIESDANKETETITPSKMLTFYKEGYNYKWDVLKNIQGRQIQYVKLIPIDSNTEIKEILLGIDAQTKHIYNLIEIGEDNTKTTITVNMFKTNEPIATSMFTFDEDKYNNLGYYIIRN